MNCEKKKKVRGVFWKTGRWKRGKRGIKWLKKEMDKTLKKVKKRKKIGEEKMVERRMQGEESTSRSVRRVE